MLLGQGSAAIGVLKEPYPNLSLLVLGNVFLDKIMHYTTLDVHDLGEVAENLLNPVHGGGVIGH